MINEYLGAWSRADDHGRLNSASMVRFKFIDVASAVAVLLADEHSLPFVVVLDGYRYAVLARSSVKPSVILASSFHPLENDRDLLMLFASVLYGFNAIKDGIKKLSDALVVALPAPRAAIACTPPSTATRSARLVEQEEERAKEASKVVSPPSTPHGTLLTCSLTSSISFPSSSTLDALLSSSAPLPLTALLGSSITSRAWLFSLPLPSVEVQQIVLKVSRDGWADGGYGPAEHAEELTREAEVLSKYGDALKRKGVAVPAVAFGRVEEIDGKSVFEVDEFGIT
ncbi:hypothetical protein JCM8547_008946 [Rhodosporidiobolus lusitaniae]